MPAEPALTRRTLTVIPGRGEPSLSMVLTVARRSEAYWSMAWLEALKASLCHPVGSPEHAAAGEVLEAVETAWDAAKARLDRAVAESAGRRWLEVCRG